MVNTMLVNMAADSGAVANGSIFAIVMVIFILLVLAGFIYVIFKMFEKSNPSVENIVLIAVLTAIAVVGRMILMSIPAVNLASFIIIMVGVVYGKEEGFLVGALSALVSGIFLGMGFWVLFQMFAWGLMGLSAGIFASKFDSVTFRLIFGLLWGFLYGWITNISAIFYSGSSLQFSAILALYINGFTYDLTHGITNAVALLVFFVWFKKIFTRAKVKYLYCPESSTDSVNLKD